MNIKNVTVAGAGVLGSQIAYQTAYKGFPVKIWVRSEGSIERAKPKLASLHQTYLDTLEAMKTDPSAYCRGLADTPDLSAEQIDALKARAQRAYESLSFTTSFEEAAQNADLVIEAIAENLAEKDAFYKALAPHLPQKTILATNSSTLLPSAIAPFTGRPEKFLALHFANQIWRNNTAEIMGHPGTDPAAFQEVVDFAAAIGMVPLELHKEQPGYILNSLLVPFLSAAEALYANGVADPPDHRQDLDARHRRAPGPLPHPRHRGPHHRLQHRGDEPPGQRPLRHPRQDRRAAQGEDRRGQDRRGRRRGVLRVPVAAGGAELASKVPVVSKGAQLPRPPSEACGSAGFSVADTVGEVRTS